MGKNIVSKIQGFKEIDCDDEAREGNMELGRRSYTTRESLAKATIYRVMKRLKGNQKNVRTCSHSYFLALHQQDSNITVDES